MNSPTKKSEILPPIKIEPESKPPSVQPRVALTKNSNKKLVQNAIRLVCLSGQTNQIIKDRNEILELLE